MLAYFGKVLVHPLNQSCLSIVFESNAPLISERLACGFDIVQIFRKDSFYECFQDGSIERWMDVRDSDFAGVIGGKPSLSQHFEPDIALSMDEKCVVEPLYVLRVHFQKVFMGQLVQRLGPEIAQFFGCGNEIVRVIICALDLGSERGAISRCTEKHPFALTRGRHIGVSSCI